MEMLDEEIEFSELLEQYMDDEEIDYKKKLEQDDQYDEGLKTSYTDLSYLDEHTITITEFLRDYLQMDISGIKTKNLTHKNLKDLTKDNPLVIGIYNKYVDIDEVIKQDYLLVKDCYGNIGSYLNPMYLRDLTKLEIIRRQLNIMKKVRISILSELNDFYNEFLLATEEYEYLTLKCSSYYEMLKKVGRQKTLKNIDKFIKKFGVGFLNIDLDKKR